MALETAATIAELNPANPIGASDAPSTLDDHIRLLKTVLQADALVNADVGTTVLAVSGVGSVVQAFDADIPTTPASKDEMEAGTEAEFRSMSPLRVAQAIAALTPDVGIILGTAADSTSGTAIDFTSIPAGTKRIVVMFSGVSTNGTSRLIVQLGDSGGIETTGYFCIYHADNTADARGTAAVTDGFHVASSPAAADTVNAKLTLDLLSAASNTWLGTCISQIDSATYTTNYSGGRKSTSGELDRVRITTVNGTDAFDAGIVNISYE